MGVSVEDQKTANERIPQLLEINKTCNKIVSVEPMIGAIDFDKIDSGIAESRKNCKFAMIKHQIYEQ